MVYRALSTRLPIVKLLLQIFLLYMGCYFYIKRLMQIQMTTIFKLNQIAQWAFTFEHHQMSSGTLTFPWMQWYKTVCLFKKNISAIIYYLYFYLAVTSWEIKVGLMVQGQVPSNSKKVYLKLINPLAFTDKKGNKKIWSDITNTVFSFSVTFLPSYY